MMTLFKKSHKDTEKDDTQDIDFLKTSIKSEVGGNASKSDEKLPKLVDILKNKPDIKSQLGGINLEAKTVEERNKGTVPEQTNPADAPQKPESEDVTVEKSNIQDVRAALAAAIKERNEDAEGKAPVAPSGQATPKPVNQSASAPGVKAPVAPSGQAAPKPVNQSAPAPGVKAPVAPSGQAVPKPSAPGVKAPAMAQEPLKEIQAQLASQKKLIDEQSKTIKDLEANIKKMESGGVNQLVTKNQEMLKQLSQRITTVEQSRPTEGENVLSDEEQAMVKAGKYLEIQMTKVNEVYDKLDTKISDMRKFMTEVDEKERKFVETEDNLNKIQRKAEGIIESELLGKSNEAIRNLEETKTKIVTESEKVFENTEKTIEKYKYEIESLKQKAESSINETGEQLKVTEYEVKKAIDEKIEYDKENMKRVDEVISSMNETVQKILGREDKND